MVLPNKIYEIGDGWPQARNVEGRDEYLQRVTTDRQEQIMLSYLGRVAYNFDKRYMLEASLRYDGSSVFGRDVRWAAFPSLGAAWAFSKEQFMKDFWFLSFGKIRAHGVRAVRKFQRSLPRPWSDGRVELLPRSARSPAQRYGQ